MTEVRGPEGTAPKAGQAGLLRRGLIAGWWTPMLDRHGPKNPLLRFVVDLLPFLVLFGILAVVYILTQG